MTSADFLLEKIKEIIESFTTDDLSVDVIPYSKTTWKITIRKEADRYFEFLDYYPQGEGVDLEALKYRFVVNETSKEEQAFTLDLIDQINKAVVLPRFYLKKKLSLAALKDIYEKIPQKKTDLTPEGKDVQGYPDVTKALKKCVRIKIKDPYVRCGSRTVVVGRVNKQEDFFEILAPATEGVQHSSELTFLNKEDAEEFIENNKDFFEPFKDKINFSATRANVFHKIPVLGSEKTYVAESYIVWRKSENLYLPVSLRK